MIKIDVLLLTKRCTEAAAAVPMIALDPTTPSPPTPGLWFAAWFDGFNILHVSITLVRFTSDNS